MTTSDQKKLLSLLAEGADWVRILLNAGLIAIAVFLILLSFRFGVDRGHIDIVPVGGHGHFWTGICGVLSVKKFNTGRYLCIAGALTRMKDAGLYYTDDVLKREKRALLDILKDKNYLNQRLKTVFSKPGNEPAGGIAMQLGWGSDAGHMDYIDLSFSLFGEKVESLYFTYFLLLTISSLLFIGTFYNSTHILSLLVFFHFILFSFLSHDLLYAFGIATITNPRFLTTLALIPMMHVAFLMIQRAPLNTGNITMLLPQAALIIFTADVRSTAYWTIIALVIFALLFAAILFRQGSSFKQAVSAIWPTISVLVIAAIGFQIISWSTDSRLSEGGFVRHHAFWTSTYYSLQHHPDWKKKYAGQHLNTSGDGPAMVALGQYVDRNKLKSTNRNKEAFRADGAMKASYMEKYLRGAYLDFVFKDPVYVAEVFFIYNSKQLYSFLTTLWRPIFSGLGSKFWLMCAAVVLLVAIDLRRQNKSIVPIITGIGAVLLFTGLSGAPNWATVIIGDSMADPTIFGSLAALSVALYGAIVVVYLVLALIDRGQFRQELKPEICTVDPALGNSD